MSKTVWGSVREGALAVWFARAADQDALVRAILRAGAETRVFRPASVDEHGQDLQPVEDDVAIASRLEPELPGREFVTPGTICWHEAGERREGEVIYVGELLERLRPDAPEITWDHIAYVPPVSVSVSRDFVSITLMTDVWFPRVIGFLEEEWPDGMLDNSELAACHTPRLNAFLHAVRDASDEWFNDSADDFGARYADMVSDDGIWLPAAAADGPPTDVSIFFAVGDERSPSDPWGRIALTIGKDGVAYLEHLMGGDRRMWSGRMDPAQIEEIKALAVRGGFPWPPQGVMPVMGSIVFELELPELDDSRSLMMSLRDAAAVDGYREAVDALQAFARELSEGRYQRGAT
ncbi:hypothetical protein OJ997_01995 [Solirubrobacter phytolaccae]|uniref:Uncharacterized protein n=1 Tax=Solirubrobacter phytolaccae TaxID=1404360 RepID=A0A9X3N7A2_9ACTN|nr:hypothetical protein [Solirubrobacter phytolaccae]MDA0179051.1 hypothetical protein [Solirubrobacter phytolaccae]